MFIRESEGVYQFGQRKVHIKVEKGNQPKVRVGGGYMNIKNFIEEFTEAEIERIERHDAIERFRNKGDVQGIIVDFSKRAVETKPLTEKEEHVSGHMFQLNKQNRQSYYYEAVDE